MVILNGGIKMENAVFPKSSVETFTDPRDGKIYRTVKISSQRRFK